MDLIEQGLAGISKTICHKPFFHNKVSNLQQQTISKDTQNIEVNCMEKRHQMTPMPCKILTICCTILLLLL